MQRTPAGEVVIVPRNFKLLQELEKSEKGLGEMGLSMGLVDPGDTFLSHWNAGILGPPGTSFMDRFYELRIYCNDKYPSVPPEVRFITRIQLSCVEQTTGKVIPTKLAVMRNWDRNKGIEDVLIALRTEMCTDPNRRQRQPAEGTTF